MLMETNLHSILEQAYETKFDLILACPYPRRHPRLRHKKDYVEFNGWDFWDSYILDFL
jgi:hypothetical protein